MFYYEDMKSDVLFSVGFNSYTCECWTGVSCRRIEDKDILVMTTNCYDEGLHDFINTYEEFNIDFTTLARNCDGDEEFSLANVLKNMKLLLHQSSFRCDSITEHLFIFGNDLTNEEDAINILNEKIKEEIIDEVLERITKHIQE